MKRIILSIICIALFSMSIGTVMAEAEEPLVSVDVHPDGSFTVTIGILSERDWETGEYNSVFIFNREDLDHYMQTGEKITPLIWWVPIPDEVTIMDYPEANYLRYPKKDAKEFVDGPRSLLRPGRYYVKLVGYYGAIGERVEFEIPEITATPTPAATPTEPPATNTPEPTSPPTLKATPVKTPGRTATPTAAATLRATAGYAAADSDNNRILWICVGAAALVVVGVITTALVLRKKK